MGAVSIGALALLFEPGSIRLEVIVYVWWMSGISIIVARTILWGLLVSLRHRGRKSPGSPSSLAVVSAQCISSSRAIDWLPGDRVYRRFGAIGIGNLERY